MTSPAVIHFLPNHDASNPTPVTEVLVIVGNGGAMGSGRQIISLRTQLLFLLPSVNLICEPRETKQE